MNSHDDSSENAELPVRRRRSFLAAKRSDNPRTDIASIATEEMAEGDDIPVLTEVVPLDQDENAAPPADEASPDLSASFDARLEELAAQMAEAIERQMACELPTLIEATLINASEELRTGITATMEAALRDFSARRKQLQLPFDARDAESSSPY